MDLFLIVVIILFILAISDLVVGVSNDAVNFLNSAIGSKVAPRHIIILVASLGIMVGTTFSSGLMEVARKGIFNPDMFYLPEIMTIFMAVMITDVLLLDLYNTFGLPTSTTVSIVFELLGAAVAVSIIKVVDAGQTATDIITYINTSKALAIIAGILLSVVVAFSVGAIIQYLTRLVFTFDYDKRIRRYGAIFGAVTLTAISFFIILKGAKGASFITEETSTWIKGNMITLMLYSLVVWAVIFQFLLWFTKINILKPIVLVGTFALALAFSANDLVNFIGVPLAGFSSYNIGLDSANPLTHLMVELTGKVSTPTVLLLLAGLIMVLALWFNKKSQGVTKTEVNLGRQDEGYERFESSLIARVIVRMSLSLMNIIKTITPKSFQELINNRFDQSKASLAKMDLENPPAFDLLRASVNLMVASILISFATSLKLPLSTTYVTFMVAMGSSLSDRAWGRESAVYRVNGVITVIGGWFLTALLAFTVAGTFAVLIHYGEVFAIVILVAFAGYALYRTHILHREREKEDESIKSLTVASATNGTEVITAMFQDIAGFLSNVSGNLKHNIAALADGDRQKLRDQKAYIKRTKKHSNLVISQIIKSVKLLKDSEVKQGRRYGKVIASMQEIHAFIKDINQDCVDHIENNHGTPSSEEIRELSELNEGIIELIDTTSKILAARSFDNMEEFDSNLEKVQTTAQKIDENELLRIRDNKVTSRNSMLFLSILSNMENVAGQVSNLVSVSRKNYQKIITPPKS